MEGEASSHPEQADPAAGAAPAGVQAGARDMDRLLAALAQFVKAFNDRYCPEMYRFQQEADFINLKQGSMSVPEYEAKFNALSAYATDMVDNEEKKGRRFRGGLEENVRTRMTAYKEKDYADLIETAKKVGKDVEEMFSRWEQSKKSKFEARQASQGGRPGGFYRGGGRFQHLKGQSEDTALAISTPVGEVVIVGVSFPKCVVSVGGRNLEVD
ncbi:hypothetical protein RHGRI_030972 [Rhododendron griersonianum]|uniref:Retrotransposon gag domain-containing protein n=1 Tax=Rhododendron griersonianum TaxID=479676 RepID=A0AAV6I6M0_9ERIC|nr:hypothetical protein RHGRI_030972 [Rhododendron griersonianum]